MNAGSDVRIRRAKSDEHEQLKQITVGSRAHWNYDAAMFARWADGLDFSPEAMTDCEPFVAEINGIVVAWAALHIPVGGVCELDELWVEPAWIGKGIGSQLFAFVAARARELGAKKLEWGSEPGAIGFYERMGARHVRDTASRSFGFVVPVMEVDV